MGRAQHGVVLRRRSWRLGLRISMQTLTNRATVAIYYRGPLLNTLAIYQAFTEEFWLLTNRWGWARSSEGLGGWAWSFDKHVYLLQFSCTPITAALYPLSTSIPNALYPLIDIHPQCLIAMPYTP